jgi:hypothetical protein
MDSRSLAPACRLPPTFGDHGLAPEQGWKSAEFVTAGRTPFRGLREEIVADSGAAVWASGT